jgi:transcriptional regulator with XRE-family HTH domain
MNTLSTLLKDTLTQRDVSIRQAARDMDVSHSTLVRVMETGDCSLDTAQRIAKWLGVPVSQLLDIESDPSPLAAQMALLIEQEPELAKVFSVAMDRVLQGDMSPEGFRELAAYAAFRFGINIPQNEVKQNDRTTTTEEGEQERTD